MAYNDIKFPAAGKGAYLRITIQDLETLQEKFGGEDYIQAVRDALDKMEIAKVRDIAEIAIKDGRFSDAVQELPIAEIAKKINDALSLTLFGKTHEEHIFDRMREHAAANRRYRWASTGDGDP